MLLDKAELTLLTLKQNNSPRYWLTALMLSLPIFMVRYTIFYSVLSGMYIVFPFWKVVLGASLFGLTTLLPIQGLAGFGTSEASWALIFSVLGMGKELAVSSGFVYHIFLIVCYLLVGGCGLLLLRRNGRRTTRITQLKKKVFHDRT